MIKKTENQIIKSSPSLGPLEIEITSDSGRKYLAVATQICREKSRGDWMFYLIELHENDERTAIGTVVIDRPMSVLDPAIRKEATLETIDGQVVKYEKRKKAN